MNGYDIKNIVKDNQDICMIFSTSYISPLKFVREIERSLSSMYINGTMVIFDFILSNGNTSERYAKVYFNGNNLESNSFEYYSVEKHDELRFISNKYYYNAKEDVDFSMLSSTQQKLILNGITI